MDEHERALLAEYFLRRLGTMVVKEQQAQDQEERMLLSRAILSTLRDCRDLGVQAEAGRILRIRGAQRYADA